jgi:predicted esterase
VNVEQENLLIRSDCRRDKMNGNMVRYKYIQAEGRQINKTIIMYHGWGSTIDSQIVLGEKLAQLGFDIIIPEIMYHDTRQPLDDHFQTDVMQHYFWKTIFESIDEGLMLLKLVGLAKENTILFGSSMGGFIASGLYTSYLGFAGLISINSSGSFILSETIFRERDSRPSLNEEEIKKFKFYDPINKKIISKSPILLLHGEKDLVVPIEGQNDFYKHLLKANENVSINFQLFKDVNHTITNTMVGNMINWLKEFYISDKV